jgi:hypothetical protein
MIKLLKEIAHRKHTDSVLGLDEDLLLERKISPAGEQAKKLGLTYFGFGRWGKADTVTHKETQRGMILNQLKKTEKAVQPAKEVAKTNRDLLNRVDSTNSDDVQLGGRGSYVALRHMKTRAKTAPNKHFSYQEFIDRNAKIRATFTKSESQALTDYTGESYSDINLFLRQKDSKSKEAQDQAARLLDIDPRITTRVANIDSAMDKSILDRDIVVMRGMSQPEQKKFEAILKSDGDKDIESRAYLSTTLSVGTAYESFGEDKKMMVIRVPKGTKAIWLPDISGHEHESEVLLQRNLKLRLIRKESSVGNKEITKMLKDGPPTAENYSRMDWMTLGREVYVCEVVPMKVKKDSIAELQKKKDAEQAEKDKKLNEHIAEWNKFNKTIEKANKNVAVVDFGIDSKDYKIAAVNPHQQMKIDAKDFEVVNDPTNHLALNLNDGVDHYLVSSLSSNLEDLPSKTRTFNKYVMDVAGIGGAWLEKTAPEKEELLAKMGILKAYSLSKDYMFYKGGYYDLMRFDGSQLTEEMQKKAVERCSEYAKKFNIVVELSRNDPVHGPMWDFFNPDGTLR